MSDSVSNAQVQDVLSSIRRLVSEEGRAPKPVAPVEQKEPAGRLVLTPSLRVLEKDDAKAEVSDTDVAEGDAPAAKQWPPADDDPCWEEFVQVAAELENLDPEPADEPSEEWPEPSEDVAQEAAEQDEAPAVDAIEEPILQLTETQSVDSALDGDQSAEVEAEDGVQAEPLILDASMKEVSVASPTKALAAKIAALEAVIGRTPDQWEPDGTGADDYSGTQVQTTDWADQEALEEADQADDAARPEGVDEEEQSTAPPFIHRAVRTQDEPEQQVAEAPKMEAESKEASIALDDAIIDEEALRDLVGDIVRQELQGALGERITRNVRKLVRREIQRALTAKELE